MLKLSNKKDINFLVVLCSVVYFVSYVSRINLGTVLVEVIASGYAPKTVAALALTACSITYGAGQLVSGYLGDKFKPQNIILIGFIITALMNLCVGTVGDGSILVFLWAINGFAQAFMWPPLVKILSNLLNDDDYKKACVRVSWGSSLGTVSMYLLAPVIIKFFDVRIVFIISGALAAVMAIIWKSVYEKYKPFKLCGNSEVTPSRKAEANTTSAVKFNKSSIVLLALIMLAIMLQGSLRDGVTNWTPTYISEIFKLDSSISILTGVILPVFSLLSFTFVSFVNRKFIKNELVCAGVTFGVGAVSAVLLLTFGSSNVVLSLVLLALLVGSMHGVNLILVCMIPAYFARFGKVSFISGLINSCTYLGAAISTYGIAVFTDVFGWNKTIVLWSVVAFLGALICIAISKKWVSFKKA